MAITIEEITAAYELEKAQRRTPVSADDLPFVFEDITPDWLTTVLCRKHSGAKALSYRLDVPDNGTSSRRRIFIEYNAAGNAAALPTRIFCKATHSLPNRTMLGIPGCIQAEVNFYNKVRPLLPIEAPVCHFANFNSALNSIVMLHDMGDQATFCTHTTDITDARAQSQLRLLATMHGKFLDSVELTTGLSIFPTWSDFFRSDDYPAFEQACDNGFVAAEEVIPARLFARRKEIWPATRKSAERHRQLPHTLCHNDVHLRNWYVAADGAMGLSDWQVTTRSHWSRDLIYALSTSLTVENRRKWEAELLRYYQDQLQHAAGRSISFDGVVDEMRRQLLTVLAFWTITLQPASGMPEMQPRDSTLEFIKRIATAMDDLDTLDNVE